MANLKSWIKTKTFQFDKLFDALFLFFNAQTSTAFTINERRMTK
jgi:hypothetical protein